MPVDLPIAMLLSGLQCWLALIAGLGVLLVIDLMIVGRRGGAMSMRAASLASATWVSIGAGFTLLVYLLGSAEHAGNYLAGYIVELSLSLDNVFVFLLIFRAFGLAQAERHRMLTYGILMALILRLIFIFAGVALLQRFHWVAFIFAAFLIWTGWRMLKHRHDHAGEEHLVAGLKARIRMRPQYAALIAIAVADILFAVDSIPAVLAITDETFIVFAANAFALLGLRPMFFLVAELVDRLFHLKTALAVLLIAIGAKMVAAEFVGKIGPQYSLPMIFLILGTGIVASLVRDRRQARLGPPLG